MSERTVSERIEIVEQTVEALRALPGRVEALEVQIMQLRAEMRGDFSAVRSEMQAEFVAVRNEMRADRSETLRGFAAVRDEMRAIEDDLRAEMHALHHLTLEEIRAGDTETRRYMRVLFEDLVGRIAVLGEGRGPH